MTMYLHITIYSYFGTDGSKAQTLGFEFGHGLGSLPSFNSSALQNFSPFNQRLSYHTSQCKLFSHYRFVLPVWASIFLLREDLAEWPRMVLNSLLECQFPKEWIYKTMPKFIYVCMCEIQHQEYIYLPRTPRDWTNFLVCQASCLQLWSIVHVLFLETGFPYVAQPRRGPPVSSPETWDCKCIPAPPALWAHFCVILC